jgi:hypothetical protein
MLGVTLVTREQVIAAAQKEGLTVGQWLEHRVNEWLDHQELRELVQMACDLSPRDGSLLRLARARVRDRLEALKRQDSAGPSVARKSRRRTD